MKAGAAATVLPGPSVPRHAPQATALTWRVLVDPPGEGATNMALDHALVDQLQPGHGTFRLYGWSCPTVSFGRNEPARGKYRVAEAQAAGFHFVRRPTGGRAVLHDQEITYAVALPLRYLGGLRATYERINRGLLAGLRALGVEAQIAGSCATQKLDAGPCFGTPAPGEIVWKGHKLVGSAQVRMGGTLLQHGSILLGSQQEMLVGLQADGLELSQPSVGLSRVLGHRPSQEVLIRHLVRGMESQLGGVWRMGTRSPEEESLAAMHEKEYRSWEWTWRR